MGSATLVSVDEDLSTSTGPTPIFVVRGGIFGRNLANERT